jgi:co-chaperonin GroES (HSP10)
MGELRRSDLGNTATELGAVDSGAEMESINQSRMPSAGGDPIEADVVLVSDGYRVTPKGDHHPGKFSIEEGPREIMKANLFDEPDVTGLALRRVNGVEVVARESRVGELARRAPRESLVWYGSHPDYYQAMLGDRILVRKDVLELEDACKTCHGRGYDEESPCLNCGGSQKVTIDIEGNQMPCPRCIVLGYDREQRWSCGRNPCKSCRGSGWRSGIVIPEVAESKPITGVVVSVGPECRLLKLGDRVIHSKFAGHELTVSKTDSYVMMRESEVLSILKARPR